MRQVYCWSSLSKEQNKKQLFGTTTRRYMQSRIIATIEHATRRTDLFRTTRQQKAQRLESQGRRNTNILFLNAPVFSLYVCPFIRQYFSSRMLFGWEFQGIFSVKHLGPSVKELTWYVFSNFDARVLRAPKFQYFTFPSLRVVKPTAKCTCIYVTDTRLKPSVLCCSLQSPFSLRSALSPCLVLRQQLSLIKCVRTLWEHLVLLWRW